MLISWLTSHHPPGHRPFTDHTQTIHRPCKTCMPMRQSSTKPLPQIPIGGNLLSSCVLKTSTSDSYWRQFAITLWGRLPYWMVLFINYSGGLFACSLVMASLINYEVKCMVSRRPKWPKWCKYLKESLLPFVWSLLQFVWTVFIYRNGLLNNL